MPTVIVTSSVVIAVILISGLREMNKNALFGWDYEQRYRHGRAVFSEEREEIVGAI